MCTVWTMCGSLSHHTCVHDELRNACRHTAFVTSSHASTACGVAPFLVFTTVSLLLYGAMGKAPLSKADKSKGQKDLGSFFTVNNKAPKKQNKPAKQDKDEDYAEHASPDSDEGSELEMGVESEEEEDLPKPKRAAKSKSAKKPARKAGVALGDDEERNEQDGKSWQANLPPIHDISEIFADIVHREPRLKDVAERVRGRKLRVATMCSGTESPLLALDMMCHFVEQQYGTPLEVEHVFSCEIEPFKQAYIERNFHPPLLFRDVCELGQSHA